MQADLKRQRRTETTGQPGVDDTLLAGSLGLGIEQGIPTAAAMPVPSALSLVNLKGPLSLAPASVFPDGGSRRITSFCPAG